MKESGVFGRCCVREMGLPAPLHSSETAGTACVTDASVARVN